MMVSKHQLLPPLEYTTGRKRVLHDGDDNEETLFLLACSKIPIKFQL